MSEAPDNLTAVTTELGEQQADATPAQGAWPPEPTSPEYAAISGVQPRERFVPATRAARWAIGAIGVCLALEAAYGVLNALEFAFIHTGHITPAVVTLYRSDALISPLDSLLYIVAGICFLRWFYLAYRNLPALGAESLYYTPIWAIVWFFVPLMNLYKPFQMMKTTWRASDPSPEYAGSAWRRARISPKIGFWWVLWIFSQLLGGMLGLESRDIKTWPDASIMVALGFCYCSLDIAAGVLLIAIIKQLGERQMQKSQNLSG